ncbi:MAG: hypothetical protein QXK88_10625 [Desulfurococcaceae archaeon]
MRPPRFSQKIYTKKELIELHKELMRKANDWAMEDVDQWIVGSLVDAAIGIVHYKVGDFRTIDYFFD